MMGITVGANISTAQPPVSTAPSEDQGQVVTVVTSL